jgi:hypothetical protein
MLRSIRRTGALLALLAVPAALAASPSANPSAEAGVPEGMKLAVDQAIAVMFEPGDRDPNWNKGGVDLLKALADKPDQALLEVDTDGDRMIAFFADEPIGGIIPNDWELVTEVGQLEGPGNNRHPVEISEIDDGYYSVSRSSYERVGDAYCSTAPIGARLYQAKGAPQNEPGRKAITYLFRELLVRVATRKVCERYEANGGSYRASFFLEDGRSLPFFNQRSGTTTLIPRRPVSEMLAKPSAGAK